jgi:hypothetical protein
MGPVPTSLGDVVPVPRVPLREASAPLSFVDFGYTIKKKHTAFLSI